MTGGEAVPVSAKRRKVPPAFLFRPIRLEIRHEQVEQLLDVAGQSRKAPRHLLLDTDLALEHGHNITTDSAARKSYRNRRTFTRQPPSARRGHEGGWRRWFDEIIP
jgi:hypothetical protein